MQWTAVHAGHCSAAAGVSPLRALSKCGSAAACAESAALASPGGKSGTARPLLCAHHAAVRRRLDRVPGGTQEVQRHLPRASAGKKKKKKKKDAVRGAAATPSSATDEAILGASSLLTELLNGKLYATIEGFCRRAASAAKPKRKANANAAGDAVSGSSSARYARGG